MRKQPQLDWLRAIDTAKHTLAHPSHIACVASWPTTRHQGCDHPLDFRHF